jgi:hypothetical protein
MCSSLVTGQIHYIKAANKAFEYVARLKQLIRERRSQIKVASTKKLKSQVDSENACYPAVPNLLSCRLLSMIVKIIL